MIRMSQEQDKIFFRNFTLTLVFIAAMMVAFYTIADLVTNKKGQSKIQRKIKKSEKESKNQKHLEQKIRKKQKFKKITSQREFKHICLWYLSLYLFVREWLKFTSTPSGKTVICWSRKSLYP